MKAMKSARGILGVFSIRRAPMLALWALLLLVVPVGAQTDPLPSWNDGPAKKAIVDFVQATTDKASPKFVAPEARIATFDQDGTLWVEHPLYSQVIYCLDRVPAVVKAKPELAQVEPFKTVLSGNREAISKLPMRDLEKILVATLTGMSVEEFRTEAKKWLDTAKDPRWKRPYTDLTYYYCVKKHQPLPRSRPHEGQGRRCSSARARRAYAVAIEVGTCRSGRTGSAPRLETFGKTRGCEEGQRRRGGKPRALGGEEGIGGDT